MTTTDSASLILDRKSPASFASFVRLSRERRSSSTETAPGSGFLLIRTVLPARTCERLLFIALHISRVRISPDAPTIAPIATSSGLRTANPEIDAAMPENELRREIVIGISAPPTLIVNRTP